MLTLGFTCFSVTKHYIFHRYICSHVKAYNNKYKGLWVVITGATDGIGLEFARKFAKTGAKLVIISRTQSKLDNVKLELESLGASVVETIQCDFSKIAHGQDLERDESFLKLKQRLEIKDIGVLINNVGTAELCNLFHKCTIESLISTYDVNIISAVLMSWIVVPQMVERKYGTIVNLSSMVIYTTNQYFNTYRQTKLALDGLSEQLTFEYPELSIVTLHPGPTKTKMIDLNTSDKTPQFIILPVKTYVNSAFNIIRVAATKGGHVSTSGHSSFVVMEYLTSFSDRIGLQKYIVKVFDMAPKQDVDERQLKKNGKNLV